MIKQKGINLFTKNDGVVLGSGFWRRWILKILNLLTSQVLDPSAIIYFFYNNYAMYTAVAYLPF